MIEIRNLEWAGTGCVLAMMTACQLEGPIHRNGGPEWCYGEARGAECEAGTPKDAGLPDDGPHADPDAAPVSLSAGIELGDSCDHTVSYEVFGVQRSNGESVNGAICHWRFDDGQESDGCSGTHTFACAGMHTAEVHVLDPQTGATLTKTTRPWRVVDPLALYIKAEAPPCGLSFQLTAQITGGLGRGRSLAWGVSNSENLVPPGFVPRGQEVSVEVSAPGFYRITASLEEEHSTGPICVVRSETSVNVVACDGGPPPDAGASSTSTPPTPPTP